LLTVVAAVPASGVDGYRNPIHVSVHPKTGEPYVLCQATGTVLVLDAATYRVKEEIEVGAGPWALAWHPDGWRAFITCRAGDTVVELDTRKHRVVRRLPVRGGPTAVQVSRQGDLLLVGVHLADAIAVLDLVGGRRPRRFAAGNGPQFLAPTGDRNLLYASNLLSNPVDFQRPPINEITVIDGRLGRPVGRLFLPGANVGRQIALAPDDSLGVVPISRPKNLIPLTQLARGGGLTNGLAFFFPSSDQPPIQLLIDQPNRFYANPFGAVFAPDGRHLFVTASGADQLIVIDVARLKQLLAEVRAGKWPRAENHLGLSRRFVVAHVATGHEPTGVACSLDGGRVFVANRMSDSITVVDVASETVEQTIALSEPARETRARRGERVFHSAARSFQGQLSCSSCHPDGGIDGLTYDLQPDGLGRNLVDNRTLLGIRGTAPFKWTGTNPDLTTQCGARAAKWIFRTQGYTPAELVALARYIRTLNPDANPYRNPYGSLTPEQKRGLAIYERAVTNRGDPIAENRRCITCHPLPSGTNRKKFDVGSAAPTDTTKEFDTPQLTNIFESAPYLHDGRAKTLEEIWTVFNPHDTHGVTNDLRKQQLNDLVEYLKTL